ncbi:hypothetical protein [Novosphingobium capsulatum]|uniref:hypothetical protein n=1 Tax=Novosphingobium capsulatum TaxID=13688 RepID=UPI000789980D|nr:hypothetical protein [Novosphingobium capsulatum]WQD95062.1 hypothetical protein U0041_20800 [Novosphingobium capsulatum]
MRHVDYDDEARTAFPDVSQTAQQRMATIMRVTAEAVQRSRCHALSHTARPNEDVEGQMVYTVNSTCKTVAIPDNLSKIDIASLAKMTPAQVSAIVKTVQDLPVSRDVNVTVVLYSDDPAPGGTSGPLSAGYAGFSDDVLDKLM